MAALAFLKWSTASSWSPSFNALSPSSYSLAAWPRSLPSAWAFLIFGRRSFFSSTAFCAHAGAASARPSAVIRIMWRMAGTSYGPLSRSDSRGASTPVPSGSSLLQPAVLSLEEHEGRAAAELGVLDGADVDHVISPLVRPDDATLDVAERPVEHRRAQPTEVVGDARELVAAGLGEARRERFLVLGQDVHDEAFRIEEVRV